MNEIDVEIEFLTGLKKQCQLARRAPARPEFGAPAGAWEIRINSRLRELEAKGAQKETNERTNVVPA